MEPRAIPAATRGPQPSPHRAATTAKPDFKTGIEHKNGNTPERHKHLKSLVLAHVPKHMGYVLHDRKYVLVVIAEPVAPVLPQVCGKVMGGWVSPRDIRYQHALQAIRRRASLPVSARSAASRCGISCAHRGQVPGLPGRRGRRRPGSRQYLRGWRGLLTW